MTPVQHPRAARARLELVATMAQAMHAAEEERVAREASRGYVRETWERAMPHRREFFERYAKAAVSVLSDDAVIAATQKGDGMDTCIGCGASPLPEDWEAFECGRCLHAGEDEPELPEGLDLFPGDDGTVS